MRTGLPIFLISLLACTAARPLQAEPDLALIRERLETQWREKSFDQLLFHFRCPAKYDEFGARHEGRAVSAESFLVEGMLSREILERWVRGLRPDGSWPDLDYTNKRRSEWPLKAHTGRAAILAIAAANAPSDEMAIAAATGKAAVAAARHWIANDYQCPNWYPNQISIPENLSVVFLFAGDNFTTGETEAAFNIIARSQASGGGSNLAELASTQIALASLSNDAELAADAFHRLAADLRLSPSEGIQSDWSYRYHGPQLYSGGYGAVHTRSFGKLVALADGTRFAFPEDKVDILYRYVLDGQRWMVYRDLFDYGAIGRSITRMDPQHKVEFVRAGVEALARVTHPRREEMAAFLRELEDGAATLSGNRYFPKVNLMVHRRPGFYTSTRMFSDSVANAELVNSEGWRTHHIADGANFLLQTGREYHNLFPVWDWRRVPGITAEHPGAPLDGNPRRPGPSGMVAGVSDGTRGAAAFDFEHGALRARKTWFYFESEYVCLGAGIECLSGNPVLTSINQCHLKSPVTIGTEEEVVELPKGKHSPERLQWVHHDGAGYVFPEPAAVVVANRPQAGAWNALNGNLSADEVSKDVFSLWIDHGETVSDGDYAYIVMPRTTASDMESRAASSPIEVVANSSAVQAVSNRASQMLQAVFWTAGRIETSGDMTLSTDAPCLLLVEERRESVKITMAAPASTPTVNLEINRPLVGEGCQWEPDAEVSRITIAVPSGADEGTSVSREFRRRAF